jgi:hypothetical protein
MKQLLRIVSGGQPGDGPLAGSQSIYLRYREHFVLAIHANWRSDQEAVN